MHLWKKSSNRKARPQMDIDIDDILAELDTTAVDQTDPVLPSDGNTTMIDSSLDPSRFIGGKDTVLSATPEKDYEKLVTLWRNERCAPELLPYPAALLSRVLRRIQEQMESIETIAMGFFEDSGQEESSIMTANISSHISTANNKLPLLCMEADLERVKFVVRSYLRCRLSKVDKYMLYLKQLEQDEFNLVSLSELLSKQELHYHERHFAISLKLLNNSILKHMPPELQAINDTEGSVSMIEEPDWNKFVFIHVKSPTKEQLQNDPSLTTSEYGKACYSVTIQELNEDIDLTIGGIYVMRYEVIRDLLRDNKVELI